jgi:TDG/mug DNA glycosylase family protein
MTVLPDILAPGLRIVFCGTAVSEQSAARGHYYAGRGNEFWRLLFETGLTSALLSPEGDASLPRYGIGMTDLAKNIAQSHDRGLRYDVSGLAAKLDMHRPTWIAFTSKEGGRGAAKALGHPVPGLGIAPWRIASTQVFVLPSPSGANRRTDYDGRPTRLSWWQDLADLVRGEATDLP